MCTLEWWRDVHARVLARFLCMICSCTSYECVINNIRVHLKMPHNQQAPGLKRTVTLSNK